MSLKILNYEQQNNEGSKQVDSVTLQFPVLQSITEQLPYNT